MRSSEGARGTAFSSWPIKPCQKIKAEKKKKKENYAPAHAHMSKRCESSLQGGFTFSVCVFWASFLTNRTNYFEWGSGSTTVMSDAMARRVVSIEGSELWYRHMKEKHTFHSHTHLQYVGIGETRAFSWPLDPSQGHDYIHAIEHHPLQDVVLVDGRFRVACALAAFSRLSEHGIVLVHDFERKNYHTLLKYYHITSRAENMVALAPMAFANHTDLRITLKRYSTRPHR